MLQQGRPVRLGGRDRPGQAITVRYRDQDRKTLADGTGRWEVALPAGPAGGPFDLVVEGSDRIHLHDVWAGEVWLCSGQSNMEWRLNQCPQAREDMAAARNPHIRFCIVPTAAQPHPQETMAAPWQALTPASAPHVSAVAFYFARRLQAELQVPVGLIIAAWGGTPAETWLPESAYALTATTRRLLAEFRQSAGRLDELARTAALRVAEWEATHLPSDPGNTGLAQGWAGPDFDDSTWPLISLPGFWQSHPGLTFNGVVWFRRTLTLPASWRGKDLRLHLGAVDDFDDTYVNGQRVGGLGRDIADAFQRPRDYHLPSNLTRGERLTIAVRVFDHFGVGGFRGQPEEMRLAGPAGETAPLALHGDWHYQVEHRLPPLPADLFNTRPWMGPGLLPQDRPAHAYHGMIHPLRRWSLRGVLWYQGESNSGRANDYFDLLQGLITGWRSAFADPGLAFLLVQLPNYSAGGDWPLLREAQARTLALPHTALAVTLDVGDTADIHPLRKQPVGERLAGLALHDLYGRPVPARGPEVDTWERVGTRLRLRFHHADGGLSTVDNQPPRGFEVCGPDGVYHPAEGRLDGEYVDLTYPGLLHPCGVRYAFSANPEVNLVNRHGLPAAPFRRDPPGRPEPRPA